MKYELYCNKCNDSRLTLHQLRLPYDQLIPSWGGKKRKREREREGEGERKKKRERGRKRETKKGEGKEKDKEREREVIHITQLKLTTNKMRPPV